MLLAEAQIPEIIAERMQTLRTDARKALKDGGVRRFTQLRAADDHISVRITNLADVERAGEVLRGLALPLGGSIAGGVDLEITDAGDQSWRIALTEPAIIALTDRTMQQSLEIIRRRIDAAGTREPWLQRQRYARILIQRQGTDRILIQMPGIGSAEELLGLIGRTGKLTFHRVDGFGDEARIAGPGKMVVPDNEDGTNYLLERRAILTGENVVDSFIGFHPQNGLPVVNFRFDTAGARIFGNYTSANIGQLFAIVLDNEVISAPRIQSAIFGGAGFIEGNFTVESATELAILIRLGALPVSLKFLERRSVGPAYQNGAFGNKAVLLHVGLRQSADPETICSRLEALGLGDTSLQQVGDHSNSELLIWVELQDTRTPREISSAVVDALEGLIDLRQFETVGPNIASGRKSILDILIDWFD